MNGKIRSGALKVASATNGPRKTLPALRVPRASSSCLGILPSPDREACSSLPWLAACEAQLESAEVPWSLRGESCALSATALALMRDRVASQLAYRFA